MKLRLALATVLALAALPAAAQARTLRPGDRGLDVRHAQEQLLRLRMLPHHQVDGIFGESTRQAVLALQKSVRISVDGIIGPRSKRSLYRRPPLRPRWPAGGRHAEIWRDLQLLVLVDKGKVVRVVQVSTGQPGYDTPLGTWKVYSKDAYAYSNKYSAPMPWASYYYGGYAMHQSDSVPAYPASHGCTRMPAVFARGVFWWLWVGTPVQISDRS